MKNSIIIFIIIFVSAISYTQNAHAQTVVVQNNVATSEHGNHRDPNIKYINGIPSNQDIGGVETNVSYEGVVGFKNYQPFTVTVTYEINYQKGPDHDHYQKIGSVVIPSGETRGVAVPVYARWINEIYTITRKL